MSRNIVICSDGTGNTFDSRVTNVTRLVKNLALDDPERQLVIYDQGVGTSARREETTRASSESPALRILPAPVAGRANPLGWLARARGLISGYGRKENVRPPHHRAPGPWTLSSPSNVLTFSAVTGREASDRSQKTRRC